MVTKAVSKIFLCVCLLIQSSNSYSFRGNSLNSLLLGHARVSHIERSGSVVGQVVQQKTSLLAKINDFAQSFVAQKNFILLDKFEKPANGDLAAAAMQFVNFCDESFDKFLNERIAVTTDEEAQQALGRIRYEINSARQKKLMEADKILRGILGAGGLKQMEAKLAYHLRRAEIDMAFMVILQLNIEDALLNNVEKAVQVMTHIGTLINEHQDRMVNAPVRLMRLLLREDDVNVRKQMLRQKLLIGENLRVPVTATAAAAAVTATSLKATEENSSETNVVEPGSVAAQATLSPQCEHIVVAAVQSWGGADVEVDSFRDTIADVLSQMTGIGGDAETLSDMQAKCAKLQIELQEVLEEIDAPKVSDMCEDDKAKKIEAPTL